MQAQLLLQRLNDADIDSTWCRQAGKSTSSKYEACCLIYVGLVGLSCKAAMLEERGHELAAQWKSDLTSATNHFAEHLMSELSAGDVEVFETFCLAAIGAASRDPENLTFSLVRMVKHDRPES